MTDSNIYDTKGYDSFQAYLDEDRYSYSHILRYEKIFGEDFVSTGGFATTEEFCAMLNLKKNQKVLDVGCGIGGSAFHMVKLAGAHVLGIDLSANMIDLAKKKLNHYKLPNIKFEVQDALQVDLEAGSFDVVYSRDTILHIPDKERLFSNFYRWLKPGGKLLITDYACGPYEQHSDNFKEYIQERGYTLLTVPDYGEVLTQVGFKNVQAIDKTDSFVSILSNELKKFAGEKEDFLKSFPQSDYDDIVNGWEDKLVRVGGGEQRWGLFVAEK